MSLCCRGSERSQFAPRYGAPWSPSPGSRGPFAVAVLAGVLHLVVGYYYLAGGLVIPGYVLIPLWAVWFLLAGGWSPWRAGTRGGPRWPPSRPRSSSSS